MIRRVSRGFARLFLEEYRRRDELKAQGEVTHTSFRGMFGFCATVRSCCLGYHGFRVGASAGVLCYVTQ